MEGKIKNIPGQKNPKTKKEKLKEDVSPKLALQEILTGLLEEEEENIYDWNTHTCIHRYTYTHTYVYIYTYATYVYIMCVYMCVYKERERGTQVQ